MPRNNETGETTYQVMVGDRQTGETQPARVPKGELRVTYMGETLATFGVTPEMENKANMDAWLESHWTYPNPVRSVAAAAVAAKWAFLEAAKDNPENENYFHVLASSAAYTYNRQGETAASVLNRVLSRLVGKAPFVASKIRKLQATAQSTAMPHAKKRRRRSKPIEDLPLGPPAELPVSAPGPWEQVTTAATNAGLPAWAPAAIGVVVVSLIGFVLIPKRRPTA